MIKPEILAPAGSPQALIAAVRSGADAVYLGVKSLMRADSEFARIVNGSDGARTFAETGVLVPSKISNADLGAMAARVRLVIGGGSN